MRHDTLFPTLIRTKLNRPPAPGYAIARPRLFELLDRGLALPMTLVCAPAGFGKTTLVSAWIESRQLVRNGTAEPSQFAWVSLDEGDNELFVFCRYVVSAIRSVFPGACAPSVDMLRSPVRPSEERVTTTLINDLAALPSDLVLVLEDYHTITSEAIHGLLQEMTRHWPPRCHWVLTSRTTPALPLARLRAQGQVVEIRSHDLRFTTDESAAYLAATLAAPLSEQALAMLLDRTEGWIAGLHLAVLSFSSAGDVEMAISRLAGSDAYIADYLVDEVLTRQPAEVQQFLLATSATDRFCADLAQYLLPETHPPADARQILAAVERANLFVVPLDSSREWYRYHALFRDLLLQRLHAEYTPDQIADLHSRTADWFMQRGHIEEALRSALAARNVDLAARLIETGMCDILNHEDRLTLERWLQLLPAEIVDRRPGLLLLKAWVLEFSWQIEAQKHVVQQITALLNAEPAPAAEPEALLIMRGQLAALNGQAAYLANQTLHALELCQEALSCLPMSWSYVRGGATLFLALALQARGQSGSAERLLIDLYESLTDKSTSYAVRPLMALCFIHFLNSQLDQVVETAEAMVVRAQEAGLSINLCWALYFLGIARYEQNDLAEARRYLEMVMAKRHVAQALTVRASLYGLALTRQGMGDHESALACIDALSESDFLSGGSEDERTGSLRARLHVSEGSVDLASHWEQSAPVHRLNQPMLWLEETPLTRARVLLARRSDGDLEAAVDLLNAVHEVALQTHNVYMQIQIHALRALALSLHSGVASTEALMELSQAVALARPGGFVRVFVELGPPMQHLLQHLAAHDRDNVFVHRLLDAFPASASGRLHRPDGAYDQPAGDHLTQRELEILALMRQRLSDKEIASKLFISITTVKRHAANLYGKLGVSSRQDAVAKAESLGILPAD